MNNTDKNPEFEKLADILLGVGINLFYVPQYVKDNATDIHISVGLPVTIYCFGMNRYTTDGGILTQNRMEDIFYKLCEYSIYTHVDEIRNGFITIGNKYRCGICGTAVKQNGGLSTIKNVTSINIRVPRAVDNISQCIFDCKANMLDGVLIIGEPSSGKTTILRDMADKLSDKRIVVVDERWELSGCGGKLSADVMLGYDKTSGISQAIRTMSPNFIVCDELDINDLQSVELAVSTGVSLIASVHGQVKKGKTLRQVIVRLIETGAFGTIVVLKGRIHPGEVDKIYGAEEFIEIFGCGDYHHKWNFSRNRNEEQAEKTDELSV